MNLAMVGVIPRKDDISGFDEHLHLHIVEGKRGMFFWGVPFFYFFYL